MNFKPELCQQVLTGAKTVTRRPVNGRNECPYGEGRDYAVCPGRGKRQLGRILVHGVRTELVGAITDADAILEGFADREAFVAYWHGLYGQWDETAPVFRVQFQLVVHTQLIGAERLTDEEQARVTAKRNELLARGYQDITEHRRLRLGARIRHRGQQWPDAYRRGTGWVAVLTEKPNSAWSREWRMPDIELVAVWDKPWGLGQSRLSGLAQYHVEVIQTGVD